MQLVGSLYKGEAGGLTAGAAAGGGGGAGSGDWWWFPPWRGAGSGQRPPGPLKGRGLFFFFLKGDSRAFSSGDLSFVLPFLLSPLPSPPSGSDFV